MHAVIDNFSRRILAWRVAETFAPVNSVAVLLDAGRAASPSVTAPVHSAFRGQTPDEMYFGSGDTVPADLTSGAAAARRARAEANRSAACETCPSLDTVA